MRWYLPMLLIIALSPLQAQQTFTLSGKVTDAETGEDLIGVSVIIPELVTGVATNSYGFYSLSIPSGTYIVQYSYLGYASVEREIQFIRNQVVNIEISPSVTAIDEVIISTERDDKNITSAESGVEKLNLKEIDNIPVLFGEKDILKTIQLLPGISNASEGSTGFNVRGGSIGQNLILLDEAPVYSSAHLAGFFSVFNSDALKDVTIYKGGIPAQYGGRAASVIDVTMNNGNSKSFSSSGGIGLVSARLTMEGPLIRDKMSFIISGRRTYGDLVARALLPESVIRDDMKFYFYDLNAKLNYTINERNRLFISGYFGKDVFELGQDLGTGWGNTTGTIRWNHLFSSRLFSRTSLIYSRYDYGFIFGSYSMRLRSGIEDFGFKEDITWYLNPENTIKAGFTTTWHRFSPGEITAADTTDFRVVQREKIGLESALYIQNEHKIASWLNTNYGIRLSTFNQRGPGWFYKYNDLNEPTDSLFYEKNENAYTYFCPEPRVALNFILNSKTSVKLSYNRMAQYLHLLSNSTSGSPTDVWMPSSNNLKPSFTDHITAGLFRNFYNNQVETSIEAYYKNLVNAADYEDGAEIIFNRHAEAQILFGEGRSYGMELYIRKKTGNLTGWVSYTLSRTENRIEGISNSEWYPVKYDKTHDISLVTSYKAGKRVTLSAIWSYATGNAVTFPGGKYIIDNNPVPYYTERNGYRMPAYHRLDINISLSGKNRKRLKSSWDFSVYNLYNRQNAYIISFRESETVPGTTEAVKLSLFGIVPSISYNFKF
jgi:hypothetical protein